MFTVSLRSVVRDSLLWLAGMVGWGMVLAWTALLIGTAADELLSPALLDPYRTWLYAAMLVSWLACSIRAEWHQPVLAAGVAEVVATVNAATDDPDAPAWVAPLCRIFPSIVQAVDLVMGISTRMTGMALWCLLAVILSLIPRTMSWPFVAIVWLGISGVRWLRGDRAWRSLWVPPRRLLVVFVEITLLHICFVSADLPVFDPTNLQAQWAIFQVIGSVWLIHTLEDGLDLLRQGRRSVRPADRQSADR